MDLMIFVFHDAPASASAFASAVPAQQTIHAILERRAASDGLPEDPQARILAQLEMLLEAVHAILELRAASED